ncbi:class I SAM-dependent methyltransferase [Saccharopolyspora sp. MS10]|uniref:class I SAM-dependent methyltransferase n=1 Tax=Saccharopolyspora sp. MS10 TaxID=3385973 RepID=UPI0039A0C881
MAHEPQHHGAEDLQIEMLDLDAEVLHDHLTALTARLRELAEEPVRRILDLGSGSGTGTFALLERFEDATAIAVDSSPAMLDHLTAKGARRGLSERIRTEQVDLDAAFPRTEGPADLVWASASLHHLADPGRLLGEVFGALRPGGLVAVAELDGFPRFLPDDFGVGRPGLEERCREVLAARRADDLPHISSDWAALLTGAGFGLVENRAVEIDLRSPLPEGTARYAELVLTRMRPFLADHLDATDLDVLDTLLADGLHRRDDLTVRTTRTFLVARRP